LLQNELVADTEESELSFADRLALLWQLDLPSIDKDPDWGFTIPFGSMFPGIMSDHKLEIDMSQITVIPMLRGLQLWSLGVFVLFVTIRVAKEGF
jgi:hypothetical protein